MPDLLLRNVPPDAHARLKERASSLGISVNEMLLRELVALADRPTMAEWVVEIDARRRPDGPTAEQVVDVIRMGRSER